MLTYKIDLSSIGKVVWKQIVSIHININKDRSITASNLYDGTIVNLGHIPKGTFFILIENYTARVNIKIISEPLIFIKINASNFNSIKLDKNIERLELEKTFVGSIKVKYGIGEHMIEYLMEVSI